jgi:predicted Rossmann fold flavoprotein
MIENNSDSLNYNTFDKHTDMKLKEKYDKENYYDVVIIGGGPAGVFCSVQLKHKRSELKVCIVEKGKMLDKLRRSGGGRCNCTNLYAVADNAKKYYPRGAEFLKHLFKGYNYKNFLNYLEENGIKTRIEENGKVFLYSNDANELVKHFIDRINEACIDIINGECIGILPAGFYERETLSTNTKKTKNEKYQKDESYQKDEPNYEKFKIQIKTKENELIDFFSTNLVVATGGASNLSNILSYFEIELIKQVPSLFPFQVKEIATFNLAGITVEKVIGYIEFNPEKKVNEDILFTKDGVSGPLILQLSAWNAYELFENNYSAILHIDFIPAVEEQTLYLNLTRDFHNTGKIIGNLNFLYSIPERLWEYLLKRSNINPAIKATGIDKNSIKDFAKLLKNCTFEISNKANHSEEFVHAGGVSLKELKYTCELKKYPSLFAIGEALNIDGITGGFNLQAAWTTAYSCACAIDRKYETGKSDKS